MAELIAKKRISISKTLWLKYAVMFFVGLIIGFRTVPSSVIGTVYMSSLFVCGWFGVRNKLDKFFTMLPFICYMEVYMRGFIKSVPYLGIQYMLIFVFGYLIISGFRKSKAHSYAFVLMIVYGFIEFLGGLFPDDPHLLRPVLVQSFALIIMITWASFNRLSPVLIHKLLTNFKLAAVFLAGVVLVAHLRGGISYNSASNFESSNGMAPVQLSGYLGFGSILLLISFMNPEESLYKAIHLVLFAVCTSVMILTFSRGGLYFVSVITLIYMYFNRASFRSYFKFIFFIPIGWGIYNYVVKETNGAIVKRYQRKEVANRDVLIVAGFKLFLDEPVFGVGTSNYTTQVVNRRYFSQSSTAHNEFVRAMAEHGLLGFFTYWLFFILIFFEIIKRTGPNKEFSIYFLALFCLIIVHNGLKISIQPILMMLAVANPNVVSIHKKIINVFKPSIIQQLPQTS